MKSLLPTFRPLCANSLSQTPIRTLDTGRRKRSNHGAISSLSTTGGGPFTVTVTTSQPINVVPGSGITITGANPSSFNTNEYVTDVLSPLRFHYRRRTNPGIYLSGGTIVSNGTFLPPAGYNLWLDSADKTTLFADRAMTVPATNTGLVAAIVDKSGQGHTAIEPITAASFPTRLDNGLHGLTVLNFMGNNGLVGTYPNVTAFTGYCIAQIDADNQGLWDITASQVTNTGLLSFSTLSTLYGRWDRNGEVHSTLALGAYPILDYFSVLWDGATITVFQHQTAGASVATGAYANVLTNVTYGGLGDGSIFPLTGILAECLMYPVAHSPTQMAAVWSYLGTKWAI